MWTWVSFLCLICFWFYVYLSLVFSVCFHLWVCLLVWLFFVLFLFVNVSVYISLCDFCLFSFAYTICLGALSVLSFFFFLFLFFCAVWLAGSWCSGWVSSLSLQCERAESRILDHQRSPSPTQYQSTRPFPEIFLSKLRHSSTQWPASSMPNN